jgi:DNA polymerase elongation subunit (family B)
LKKLRDSQEEGDGERKMATDVDVAWLVNASHSAGQVSLSFIRARDAEPFRWVDSFQSYYLTKDEQGGEPMTKRDLFTQNDLTLYKMRYRGRPPKNIRGWEVDIDPALSYVYDKGLRFGVLHRFEDNSWVPQVSLRDEQLSGFERLFGGINKKDPLKYTLVKEAYAYANQPVPRIEPGKLGLPDGSEEDYYTAFLLSRIANLPITRTYRNYSVSDWIRSMLYTYYRANGILIPNPEELMLGDTRKYVTGALTIAPESGTYFNMFVLDFESLYSGCIDVFNLSYETVRCPHPECQGNMVPGLDYNVCTRRRGIYAALTGALRDLRLQVYKPLAKSTFPDAEKNTSAAGSRILKLFLVSCYGVTVRIRGLASPLLGEAITAYGRYVLQSSWDAAKDMSLKPRYGDTDSIFLDNPAEEDVGRLIQSIRDRFGLQLAYDRVYSVCVLSAAKKAYFGILPSGEPEVKGLSIAKSNSPRFFQQTFNSCLAKLSEGRHSRSEFELAKQQVPEIVREAIRELREGKVILSDLEYRVDLREDPREKSRSKTLPQPYQAAWLLLKEGKKLSRRETVGFVKVHPFRSQGRQFTVKPTSQTNSREINASDYVRNLISSLNQTFEPMGITISPAEARLSDFV